MFRVNQKEKILGVLGSMRKIHSVFWERAADAAALQDCQEAAIAVGTALERETGDFASVISLLEQYCEEIYQFSQNMGKKELAEEMDATLKEAEQLIKQQPAVYQMVFMPYKAQMWDSLESIYLACRDDERCECLVVPIPYYEYTQVGRERRAELCYDGELFPEDIPVTHYEDYRLDEECPDVVFLHNPFDNYNLVTSVHPDYYSTELKKYARLVVYSPYYVTSGFVGDSYLNLPSNNHFDYIIAQSQHAKEYYRGLPCYDKVLPFGSPKLDRVIRMSRKKPQMPEEWREVIGDRKTLMLNTSIGCILYQGEIYLEKLRHIFAWFQQRDDIALIWRPHPLLESTLKSMRSGMLEKYHALLQFFQEEGIGVLDQTADISVTVALSDGYIGENASSVINLFLAAGKPLFILNNLFYEPVPEKYQNRIKIWGMVKGKDRWYLSTEISGMYAADGDWTQLHLEKEIEGAPRYGNPYGGSMAMVGDTIYLTPTIYSPRAICYHTKEKRFEEKFSHQSGCPLNFIGVASCQDRVIYFPRKDGAIVIYDTKSHSLRSHSREMAALKGTDWNPDYEEVTAWCVDGCMLYVTAVYTNRVLRMNLEKGTWDIFSVGEKAGGYTAVAADENSIWLAEACTGEVICCDKAMKVRNTFSMPPGWHCWKSTVGRGYAFGSLLVMGRWIVAVPCLSDSAVRIDRASGECRLLVPEFFEGKDKPQNGYHPAMYDSLPYAAEKLDETHFIVQLRMGLEQKLAIVDVEQETCQESYTALDAETCEKMKAGDGFEKIYAEGEFARRESPWFDLEGFADDLVQGRLDGVMRRQAEAISTMTDNLDGTCGERIHTFLMSELEKKG